MELFCGNNNRGNPKICSETSLWDDCRSNAYTRENSLRESRALNTTMALDQHSKDLYKARYCDNHLSIHESEIYLTEMSTILGNSIAFETPKLKVKPQMNETE